MPLQAKPINIERGKRTLQVPFEKNIWGSTFTAAQFQEVAGDHPFELYEVDCGLQGGGYLVRVLATRLETDEEQASRIARQENYNRQFDGKKV